MRVSQTIRELATDEQREIDGQALFAMPEERERTPEVSTLDVLEREEVLVGDAADLEHLGDVDVLELDRDLRLVDEPRDERLVGREVREHLLDDDKLLEPREPVLGEKDFAHAAAGEPLDQEIAPEHLRQARILAPEWATLGAFVGLCLQRCNPTLSGDWYNDHVWVPK